MSDLWAAIDEFPPDEFVARVDALAAELPAGSAIGLFERGCARDSTGHPAEAATFYKSALDAGLIGERRRRAIIQMASSLRNLVGLPRPSRCCVRNSREPPIISMAQSAQSSHSLW